MNLIVIELVNETGNVINDGVILGANKTPDIEYHVHYPMDRYEDLFTNESGVFDRIKLKSIGITTNSKTGSMNSPRLELLDAESNNSYPMSGLVNPFQTNAQYSAIELNKVLEGTELRIRSLAPTSRMVFTIQLADK